MKNLSSAAQQFCSQFKNCSECPLRRDEDGNCVAILLQRFDIEEINKAAKRIETWANTHSGEFTRMSKLLATFPDADLKHDGTPVTCAKFMFKGIECSGDCYNCWREKID